MLLGTMYTPYSTGAAFAEAFAALEDGNAEPMWRMSADAITQAQINTSCDPEVNSSFDGIHTTLAIACGDGVPVNENLDELRVFISDLSHQSYFGDVWTLHVGCA